MKDRSVFNKIVIMTIPFFGCLASMVSGYFLVYFTMLEASFKASHNYSMEENDKYFTIMVTALPVGAFLGTSYFIQALSFTIDLSMVLVRIKL